MANSVLFLEKLIQTGKISRGTEIFLFRDNFVTERAFFCGMVSRKSLFDLVLRLWKLEMVLTRGNEPVDLSGRDITSVVKRKRVYTLFWYF